MRKQIRILLKSVIENKKRWKRNGTVSKNINLTATNRYIDTDNRRLVKTADALDKYDVNKGQLDNFFNNNCYRKMFLKN